MTEKPQTDPHTLGYWVRLVDRLLEIRLEHILASDLLTRPQWQILSIVHQEPLSESDLEMQLLPFVGRSATPIRVHLDDLMEAGWLDYSRGRYTLAEHRVSAYTATASKVQRMRRAVMSNISVEDYHLVMRTLAQVAGNLGWDERAAA